jgi:hypothetical protein
MKPEQSSLSSDRLIEQKGIKKFQSVEQDPGLDATKMLAQQVEKLHNKETTTDVAGKDTGDYSSVMHEDLRYRRNSPIEKGKKAVLRSLDSRSAATSAPETVKKQEELMASFSQALAPFRRKIVEYKDKWATFSLLGHDNQTKITEAYREARDLMWQAEQALNRRSLDSRSAATSAPETVKKQEELMRGFSQALDPFRKIVEYKDKSAFSFVDWNVDELINNLHVALEAVKNSELVPKLPMGVSQKEPGVYSIDLSHFEPSDLAKLDLSRPKDFTFFVSNSEGYKYSNNLPFSLHTLNIHITRTGNILKNAFLLKTYTYSEDNAKLYKDVSKFYTTLQLYANLGKTDLNESNFSDWFLRGHDRAEILLGYNNTLHISDSELKNPYVYSIKIEDKIKKEQNNIFTSTLLFSNNESERAIANEMVVTHAYRDLWANSQIERPDTEGFETDYSRAQGIVEKRIEDIQPEDREEFLKTIYEVNQSLRNAAQDLTRTMPEVKTKGGDEGDLHSSQLADINEVDLNPFQLTLKRAIVATDNHHNWALTWTKEYESHFNFDDSWLRGSMKRLGITKEDVARTCQDFLENENVRRFIDGISAKSINDIAYTYSSNDALKNYEELVKANARLKHRYDLLRDGIPVTSIPDRINGREVYETPGNRLNCLIHSLIKVSHPEWKWSKIVEEARPIRKMLVDANLATDNEMIDINELRLISDDTFDMGQTAGQRIIEELTKRAGFEPSRGLWIYQSRWEGTSSQMWRMRCHEVLPRTETKPDKPPYALHLNYDVHFNAMSAPI